MTDKKENGHRNGVWKYFLGSIITLIIVGTSGWISVGVYKKTIEDTEIEVKKLTTAIVLLQTAQATASAERTALSKQMETGFADLKREITELRKKTEQRK